MIRYIIDITRSILKSRIVLLFSIPLVFLYMDIRNCSEKVMYKNDFLRNVLGGIGTEFNFIILFKSLIFIIIQVILVDISRSIIIKHENLLVNRVGNKIKISLIKILAVFLNSLLYSGIIIAIVLFTNTHNVGDYNTQSIIYIITFCTGFLINNYYIFFLSEVFKMNRNVFGIYFISLILTAVLFLKGKIPVWLSLASYCNIRDLSNKDSLIRNFVAIFFLVICIIIFESRKYNRGV